MRAAHAGPAAVGRPFALTGGGDLPSTPGQAYLAAMHRQGAELWPPTGLTKSIVAEITKAPMPTAGVDRKGESQTERIEVAT